MRKFGMVVFFSILVSTQGSGEEPGAIGRLECYRRGREKTTLTRNEVLELCRCASSKEPAECYVLADRETTLTPRQKIDLCRDKVWCVENDAIGDFYSY